MFSISTQLLVLIYRIVQSLPITGVTSDLPGRLFEHQNELTKGFTSRYGVKTLVWFEEYDLVTTAITREKTIKKWPRQWKLNLIEAMNPDWEDIAHYLHGL